MTIQNKMNSSNKYHLSAFPTCVSQASRCQSQMIMMWIQPRCSVLWKYIINSTIDLWRERQSKQQVVHEIPFWFMFGKSKKLIYHYSAYLGLAKDNNLLTLWLQSHIKREGLQSVWLAMNTKDIRPKFGAVFQYDQRLKINFLRWLMS